MALQDLEPGARALLELSLVRRVDDEAIGELLGIAPSEVAGRREALLDRLAMSGEEAAATLRGGPPRRRLLLAVLPPVVLGAIVAIVVASGSSDSDDGEGERSAPRTPPPRAIPLRPLGPAASRARATATVRGDRLVLRVRGLPRPGRASYEVWLYDSVASALSLGRFRGSSIELDAPLPARAARRRFLDISLEPPDGNPRHSGASVLRAPL
jgi:hypothetical protein